MTKNRYKFIIFIILSFILKPIFAQIDSTIITSVSIDRNSVCKVKLNREQWVDSVFNSLNEREKIGQLLMIRAHSNKTKAYHEMVARIIRQQKVGGLCFFQGGPLRQVDLVNYYQKISKTPLLIAIDGEWGVSMRLDSAIKFPRQMTLGAIQNDSLIYQMGVEVARQCKAVGVNLNFAPVADVNNNPANPVINSRSFGENPKLVAEKASMYMKGMQSQHLLSCAKHFPGHGDTDSDSHKTLPTVKANRHDLDSIHFQPFKTLINEGISTIMVAHLYVPAIDSTANRASSLSPIVVKDLLKRQFHFKGLAITDALEMKGVANYFPPGKLEVMALKAGNDILLMPHNAKISIDSIVAALHSGELDSNDIYSRVRKILSYKYSAGLNNWHPLSKDSVYTIINSDKAKALNKKLYRNALTLIVNKDSIIPLTTNLNKTLAIVSVGVPKHNPFTHTALKYRAADLYSIKRNAATAELQRLANKLKSYDYVILTILNTNNSTHKHYGIYQSSYDLANLIAQHSKLIINLQANPYASSRFLNATRESALLISYNEAPDAQEAAAEAIFGGETISGKLPVSINDTIRQAYGITIKKKRLSFGLPEEIGIAADGIAVIDSIIQNGIDTGAYPGCQVLIAKDGFVFYDKSFGHQTYNPNSPIITDTTIYDLASITKVMATTLSLMHLVDQGKLDVDRRLAYYLPELNGSNKAPILIRDLLSHQARLTPWIPFYLHSLHNNHLDSTIYRHHAEAGFSTEVTPDIFIIDSYKDSIMTEILNSKLLKKKKYRYSDLGMYYMRRIIEKLSGMSVQDYLNNYYYKPLGLQHIGYLPLLRFPRNQMAPTEEDTYFRHEKIQGTVHDPGCAMMGGIEGHAGLFSNSLDLAIISQMLLQNGTYAAKQYIKKETLADFTRQQFPLNDNRRGLGFDKAVPNHEDAGPSCQEVSPLSFGHSGFTGTLFWVDPQYNIIYVFLSNRTFPTAENLKLIHMNIRTKIQKQIYHLFGIDYDNKKQLN